MILNYTYKKIYTLMLYYTLWQNNAIILYYNYQKSNAIVMFVMFVIVIQWYYIIHLGSMYVYVYVRLSRNLLYRFPHTFMLN